MYVIGLTGGIGSGKSQAADFFKNLGIDIIDADVIARSLTEKNTPTLKPILDHFGPKIQDPSGRLDRRALRQIIFKSQDEKKWLEGYLHPLIKNQIYNQCLNARSPYCIAVIPLLTESGSYDFLNRICVIDTEEKTQIARAKLRDGQTEAQIKAIMATQASRAKRQAIADDIIVNNETLDALKQKIISLHQYYLSLTNPPQGGIL